MATKTIQCIWAKFQCNGSSYISKPHVSMNFISSVLNLGIIITIALNFLPISTHAVNAVQVWLWVSRKIKVALTHEIPTCHCFEVERG